MPKSMKGVPQPGRARVPDGAPAAAFRLALAEQRRRGLPFDQAWERAISALPLTGLPDRDVEDWRVAISATMPAWRRAFLNQPAERAELVVAQLADALPDKLLVAEPSEVLELALAKADAGQISACGGYVAKGS